MPEAAPSAEGPTDARITGTTASMKLSLDLNCGAMLGEGTSGAVYAVDSLCDGRQYALKVKKKGSTGAAALAECQLHAALPQCETIVQYCFAWTTPSHVYVLMERMATELWQAVLQPPTSSAALSERLQWSKDVLSAVACLHSIKVAHRDVNPWNLFVSFGHTGRRCKLGDLGLAARLPKSGRFAGRHELGAPSLDESAIDSLYSAPELGADAEAGGYSLPADVFSTGVVLVAIWHSAVVFDASEDAVTDATEAVRRSGELPWIVPCRIARLVRRLTSHYPEQRPSAGEAAAVLMAMASAHDAIAAVAEEVDAPAGASSVRPPHPRPWKLPWPSWRRRRGTVTGTAARRPVQLSVKV